MDDWNGQEVEKIKKDFDYIFLENLQRIKDDENDIVNMVKSLLFCKMKKIDSTKDMKIKWGLLFKKIRTLKKWPTESWCWNALIYNSSKYLKEFVWENNAAIAEPRKFFVVEDLKSHYITDDNKFNGKICLSKEYLKDDYFWSFSKHDFEKDGRLFFYNDKRADKDGLVVKQLNEFNESNWEKSLYNFWYPGVIQYYRLKDKSKCNLEPLKEALKKMVHARRIIHFDYQKGPCRNDKCYYSIWLELIKLLDDKTKKEFYVEISDFFPVEYEDTVSEILREKA